MNGVRAFVCIELPDNARSELMRVLGLVASIRAPVRWVAHMNLHLTLKFLGSISTDVVTEVSRSMRAVALGTPLFTMRLAGTGAFPNWNRPRVLWVGAQGDGALLNLQSNIDDTLMSVGFAPEARVYNPHITIGRVKASGGVERVVDLLKEHVDDEFGEVQVRHVTLMRSDLTPGGAKYLALERFRFIRSPE